jgi:hypothetical protein
MRVLRRSTDEHSLIHTYHGAGYEHGDDWGDESLLRM